MTSRIEARLAAMRADRRRKGLAPFVTAFDGGAETTLALLRAIDDAGAACAELGLAFSDPIADGPVLRAASERALAAGSSFERLAALVRDFRRGPPARELPIAVMSYVNPLLRRGLARSVTELAAAGADALIVADLPVEEGCELAEAARSADLCPIFFASPTSSDERIARAARASRGFLYAIVRTGVTGCASDLGDDAQSFLARVRACAGELPVAVGFGLRTSEDVRAATRSADLAIVGSALVERAAAARAHGGPEAAARAAAEYLADLSQGL